MTNSYDPSECTKQLTAKGLTPVCDQLPTGPQYHCVDLVNIDPAMHEACANISDWYFPVPTIACVHTNQQGTVDGYQYFPPKTRVKQCYALGEGWDLETCYCCCSCFAYGTPVAVPEGLHRPVETLAVGDKVLAGWPVSPGNAPDWRPVGLTFSDGVAHETDHVTVYLAFGDPQKPEDMICSNDQPLMLTSGKLTTASKLRRGDELMRLDGSSATVQTIAIGEYTGGVHHIGTGVRRTDDKGAPVIDGHLIGAGGLVTGDYYLQLYFGALDISHKEEEHDGRPELGTPEYAEANREALADVGMLFADPSEGGQKHIRAHSGRFTVYSGKRASDGPAASYLTADQAEDILANGTQMPLSQTLPRGLVETAFKQLRGFFPDVVFYLDWLDMVPNVHAVEGYGEKVVVITGGLARLTGFDFEGLFFAICAGLGRFSDLTPRGIDGFAGTGAADWWAFAVPPRVMFVGPTGLSFALKGMKQIESLFALVSPAHRGGNPDDPVNEPSLDCRIDCIASAIGGGSLLPCAGGPQLPLLALNSVSATTTSAYVQLSLPPIAQSAEDASHYTFSPTAKVKSAKVSTESNLAVALETTLENGVEYELTISGIESLDGTGVDPAHDSVRFKVTGGRN